MSSKESIYKCKKCKKMCIENNDELKGYCELCRLTNLKIKYTEEKLQQYNKFEIRQQLKRLSKKVDTEDSDESENYFSDEVSCSEDAKDLDYVPDSEDKKSKK